MWERGFRQMSESTSRDEQMKLHHKKQDHSEDLEAKVVSIEICCFHLHLILSLAFLIRL